MKHIHIRKSLKWSVLPVVLFALSAIGIFAGACSSGAVMNDEFDEKFNQAYSARQATEEEKKAELQKLLNSLRPQRQEEFNQWFDERFPAKEQRKSEFEEFYAGAAPSLAARKAEILSLFKEAMLSGGHEVPSLSLMLSGVNPEGEIMDYARRISAEVTLVGTVPELAEIYKKNKGSEVPEDIKPEDLLPSNAIISPSGMVTVPIYTPHTTVGYLGQKQVMTNGRFYSIICEGTTLLPPEVAGKVFATFEVLPNMEEGQWKEEVLVDNRKVLDICKGQDGDPAYYEDVNVVVFNRPEIKLFPMPASAPIKVAKITDIKAGGWLLLPTTTDRGLIMSYGMVLSLNIGTGFGPPFIEFMGVPTVTPGPWDIGAPVYYIEKNAEDPVRLIGFISEARAVPAIILPAYFIFGNIKEFPYELILSPS